MRRQEFYSILFWVGKLPMRAVNKLVGINISAIRSDLIRPIRSEKNVRIEKVIPNPVGVLQTRLELEAAHTTPEFWGTLTFPSRTRSGSTP